MFLIFIIGTLLQITYGQTAGGSVLHAASACYGDSSGQGLNQLVITCTEGRIYIENIRVALKPAVLGCPAVEHNLTPADQQTCCTLNATADCVNTYRGYSQLDFYRDCNGRVSCSKPVVWDGLTCPDPAPYPAPTVSNYMVLEYYCQTEGVYNSSCADVTDCRYAHPECRSQVCVCESGYTYVGSECERDGDVGGVCLKSSNSSCADSNSECSFGHTCACKIGYAEQNGTCIISSEALYRDEACYGALADNQIRLNCTTGYIHITRLRVAAKPLIASCPELNGNGAECCTSDVFKDCVNDYTGETVGSFHECNGLRACTKPVVRQQLQCGKDAGIYPASSTFMIVDYHCLEKGQNFGICNTTGDCSDPAASCDKARCHCVEGYTATHYFDDCWQDGFPNGKCEFESGTACYLNGTLCDHGSRKCVCGDAFIAPNNGICDAENSYKTRCNSTTDCQMDNMVCEKGRCDCRQHFIYTRGQCLSDNDYNMSCNASTKCKGDNIVCKDGRCICTPGHTYRDSYCSPEYNKSCAVTADCPALQMVCTDGHCLCAPAHSYIQAACRQDGSLGGRCNSSLPCVDANTTCNNDTHTCQCEPTYSEFENKCYRDGEPNGRCRVTADCNFTHAICVDNTCICHAGYTLLDGKCLSDGSNGAPCLNTPGIATCLDVNAVCTEGRCVCLSKFQNVHGVCRQDQHLGGWCNYTHPCLDAFTNCSDTGTCECVSGYQGVNGSCVRVGSVGGTCFPNVTCSDAQAVCAADDIGLCMTGVCHTGICQCSAGTALSVAGLCLEHGSTGGLCNGTIACRDGGAVCTEGRCTCKGGFKDINGVCRQDQHLGGWCNSTHPCLDAFTNCSDTGTCECVSGYQGVNGSCVRVGSVGGTCFPNVTCSDKNAVCKADDIGLCMPGACQPGVCQCKAGTSLSLAGLCVEHGSTGGLCNGTIACRDANAVCTNGRCTCKGGFKVINRVCMQDQHYGGWCNSTTFCIDSYTNCSDAGTCECVSGYQAVNGSCVRVGDVGGVCSQERQCRDENARCVTDGLSVCAGTPCLPGLCDCLSQWRPGPGGICRKDCTSKKCMANAVCDNSTNLCVCPQPFTAVSEECIAVGDVGGTCAGVSDGGSPCRDQHAVCVNHTCTCNKERNYILRDRECQKNDTYVTGQCGPGRTCKDTNSTCRNGYCVCKPGTISVNGVCSKGFDIPGACDLASGNICTSSNTDCKTGSCVCKSGFLSLLGQCKPENTSVVSKCPGDSPYNTLSHECPERMRAVVTSSVLTVVRRNPDCPVAMDTYEHAQFERCCSVHGEDCVLGTTGCNNSVGYPTYDVQEYVCVDDDAAISPGDNRTVTGQPVFIVSPNGGGSSGGGGNGGSGNGTGGEICAIQASCLTEIAVYALYIEQGADSACVSTLMFNAVPVRCPFTNPVFTSSKGFFTLNVTNPSKVGQYSLKVEASHPQAEVTIACGLAAPTQIEPPSAACGATGAPPTAYPATTLKQEEQKNSTALAVAIPVCILVVAAIAAALLIRFSEKIRDRFCPVKKMPDFHDPTPARTKFFGREESGSSAPKADPDSAPRPPARLPPLGPSVTTPSNKRFRRGATLVEFITSQEKHMMKKSNMKDKLIVTMDDTSQSPNVDTGKPHKKKKGRKKLLNTATHAFSAAKHMQSKVCQKIIPEGGTFTPKEDFYTYSAPNGGPIRHVGMRGHLDLPMGIQPAFTHFQSNSTSVPPPAPRGQLPPIRAPPLEGLPPQDFMEAEALPSSIRMPSRQGLLANGTSSGTSWAQVLPSSIGNSFLARGQGQHPAPDPTDQSAAPNRRIIRRPSQVDIKTLTDE